MTSEELKPVHDGQKSFWGRAKVEHHAGAGLTVLMSYDTVVCTVDAAGNFHRTWRGWSRTTAKHIVEFFRQFCNRGPVPHKAVWLAMPVENPWTSGAAAAVGLLSLEARP